MKTRALQSLLVPIDLSPLSDRAVRRAVSLPVAAGGTITLLHVVPRRLPISARRRAEKDARTALASAASRASEALQRDVAVDHCVTVGTPAAEIADSALRLKADLVVMGRGAGRPVRDAFLGSTAERMIRQARMPVLIVRLSAPTPYRRPMLGLDLDEAAEPALAMLFRVIPPPRPRATLVHAYDAPYLGKLYGYLSEDEIKSDERRYRRTVIAKIANVIARALRADAGDMDSIPDFKTYVRYGDARSVLKTAVRTLDTDLLVVGTRGRSGVAYLFLGTVAGDLLRDVRCDVLVVPPRRAPNRTT
jgi:nucleotide-binding universal stress UspA family protein